MVLTRSSPANMHGSINRPHESDMLHDTRNPVCARMPHSDVVSHESVSFAHAGSTGSG